MSQVTLCLQGSIDGLSHEDFGMDEDEFFDFCDLDSSEFEVETDYGLYANITSEITGQTFYAISKQHLS